MGRPSHFSKDIVDQQCLGYMPKIIHNCDTASRLKFGGGHDFGTDDVYAYSITPKKVHPAIPPAIVPGDYTVTYKVILNSFSVHGGGCADDDWGQNQLLPNIRSYGVVSG
jgi:hypothetical protein